MSTEIHHLDGDPRNNDIDNLKPVRRKKSSWPPVMLRMPLEPPFDEDGEPIPPDKCIFHEGLLATCRVHIHHPSGQWIWETVCDSCADDVEAGL